MADTTCRSGSGALALPIALLLLGLGGGCAAPEAGSPADAVSAIRRAHDAMYEAAMSGEWAKALPFYSDSVVLLPPQGEPVVGKEAFAALVSGAAPLEEGETKLHEIQADGRIGYLWGSYTKRYRDSTGTLRSDRGDMLEVFVQEEDGVWRLLRDSWSSIPVEP